MMISQGPAGADKKMKEKFRAIKKAIKRGH
jgi:hypothetical protein